MKVTFAAYCKPQPQGSIQSFILPNKEAIQSAAEEIHEWKHALAKIVELITAAVKKTRAILTSDNSNLKAYRKEVAKAAKVAMEKAGAEGVLAGKHVPVEITVEFIFERPASVSAKRRFPVVKPDIDKLERATLDALSGCVYEDDAQVVSVTKGKRYGPREGVFVSAWTLEDEIALPLTGELFPEPPPKSLPAAPKKSRPVADDNW